MKTYNKTIEQPRLVISYDNDAESPRKYDGNIGYFFTQERKYRSPDGNTHKLYDIMVETEDNAKDTASHIKLIKERALREFGKSAPKDEDLHIIDIYPVVRYEHGNIVYKRGTANGFDYSNCGFYIVTAQSISGTTQTTESIEKAIDAELEIYTKWCNGEVYAFDLYGDDGEVEEGCGGFYDIEDIREYLPEGEGWENENLSDYLTN